MEAIQFKLADFEGPLDLLLSLVAKNKMNIYDIDILSLIDQYVVIVQTAKDGNMEAASEFIELAARLVQMKSYFLLPKSEEAERLREELTGQLIEYSLCKTVALKLREMSQNIYSAVREPLAMETDFTYRLLHDVRELEGAYAAIMGKSKGRRAPRNEQFEPIVSAPFVSVSSRIVHVLRGLITGKISRLRELFNKQGGKSQTVATFLAILELVRAGRVTINTDETLKVKKRAAQRR